MTPFLHKLVQRTQEKQTLHSLLYDATTVMISKFAKGIIKKIADQNTLSTQTQHLKMHTSKMNPAVYKKNTKLF